MSVRQMQPADYTPQPQVVQFTSLQQLAPYAERRTFDFPSSPVVISLFSQRLTTEHVQVLCESVSMLQSLTSLDLGSNCLGDGPVRDICAALVQAQTPLVSLNLGGNCITDAGALELSTFVAGCNTLTSLNLRFNNIGSAGMSSLAKALQRHNIIQNLNLSANRIGPEGGQALALSLNRNQTLVSLDLFGNELEDLGCIPLCQTLANCPSLTFINLWCNFIGPRSADAIADMLLHGAPIQELQLGSNQIGNPGCRSLGRGIARCQTLLTVDLGDNGISDDGATVLATALTTNVSITSFVLRNNHIHRAGAIAIAESLRAHPKMRMLNLGGNDLSRSDCDSVTETLSKNTVLTQLVCYPRTGTAPHPAPIQKLNVDQASVHGPTSKTSFLPQSPNVITSSPVRSSAYSNGSSTPSQQQRKGLASPSLGASRGRLSGSTSKPVSSSPVPQRTSAPRVQPLAPRSGVSSEGPRSPAIRAAESMVSSRAVVAPSSPAPSSDYGNVQTPKEHLQFLKDQLSLQVESQASYMAQQQRVQSPRYYPHAPLHSQQQQHQQQQQQHDQPRSRTPQSRDPRDQREQREYREPTYEVMRPQELQMTSAQQPSISMTIREVSSPVTRDPPRSYSHPIVHEQQQQQQQQQQQSQPHEYHPSSYREPQQSHARSPYQQYSAYTQQHPQAGYSSPLQQAGEMSPGQHARSYSPSNPLLYTSSMAPHSPATNGNGVSPGNYRMPQVMYDQHDQQQPQQTYSTVVAQPPARVPSPVQTLQAISQWNIGVDSAPEQPLPYQQQQQQPAPTYVSQIQRSPAQASPSYVSQYQSPVRQQPTESDPQAAYSAFIQAMQQQLASGVIPTPSQMEEYANKLKQLASLAAASPTRPSNPAESFQPAQAPIQQAAIIHQPGTTKVTAHVPAPDHHRVTLPQAEVIPHVDLHNHAARPSVQFSEVLSNPPEQPLGNVEVEQGQQTYGSAAPMYELAPPPQPTQSGITDYQTWQRAEDFARDLDRYVSENSGFTMTDGSIPSQEPVSQRYIPSSSYQQQPPQQQQQLLQNLPSTSDVSDELPGGSDEIRVPGLTPHATPVTGFDLSEAPIPIALAVRAGRLSQPPASTSPALAPEEAIRPVEHLSPEVSAALAQQREHEARVQKLKELQEEKMRELALITSQLNSSFIPAVWEAPPAQSPVPPSVSPAQLNDNEPSTSDPLPEAARRVDDSPSGDRAALASESELGSELEAEEQARIAAEQPPAQTSDASDYARPPQQVQPAVIAQSVVSQPATVVAPVPAATTTTSNIGVTVSPVAAPEELSIEARAKLSAERAEREAADVRRRAAEAQEKRLKAEAALSASVSASASMDAAIAQYEQDEKSVVPPVASNVYSTPAATTTTTTVSSVPSDTLDRPLATVLSVASEQPAHESTTVTVDGATTHTNPLRARSMSRNSGTYSPVRAPGSPASHPADSPLNSPDRVAPSTTTVVPVATRAESPKIAPVAVEPAVVPIAVVALASQQPSPVVTPKEEPSLVVQPVVRSSSPSASPTITIQPPPGTIAAAPLDEPIVHKLETAAAPEEATAPGGSEFSAEMSPVVVPQRSLSDPPPSDTNLAERRKTLPARMEDNHSGTSSNSGGSPLLPPVTPVSIELPENKKELYHTLMSNTARRQSLDLRRGRSNSVASISSYGPAEDLGPQARSEQVQKALQKGEAVFACRTILPGKKDKDNVSFTITKTEIKVALKVFFGKDKPVMRFALVPNTSAETVDSHPRGLVLHTPERNEPVFFTCKQREQLVATVNEFVREITPAMDTPLEIDGQQVEEEFSHPFQVIYDFEASDPRMLTIVTGEIISVLGDRDGWYLARNQHGEEGLVPPTYLQDLYAEGYVEEMPQ